MKGKLRWALALTVAGLTCTVLACAYWTDEIRIKAHVTLVYPVALTVEEQGPLPAPAEAPAEEATPAPAPPRTEVEAEGPEGTGADGAPITGEPQPEAPAGAEAGGPIAEAQAPAEEADEPGAVREAED